jgi:hypothetical protein
MSCLGTEQKPEDQAEQRQHQYENDPQYLTPGTGRTLYHTDNCPDICYQDKKTEQTAYFNSHFQHLSRISLLEYCVTSPKDGLRFATEAAARRPPSDRAGFKGADPLHASAKNITIPSCLIHRDAPLKQRSKIRSQDSTIYAPK